MGDTLEIFGKEYTNVAGFKAKDSSGNTLTYTRGGGGGITPTGTINITTNGTHDVTNYASASVAVPVGTDMPTFTITWNTDYTTITSVTCDKTYAECYQLCDVEQQYLAEGYESNGTDSPAHIPLVHADHGGSTSMGMDFVRYTAMYYSGPYLDITYYSNGTIVGAYPSTYNLTLNATANGTYTPPDGVYTEVNVNVPSSGIDTSDATLTNGDQMLEDVTAYSNGVKYTGTIVECDSDDISLNYRPGNVRVSKGFYPQTYIKSIPTGTEGTPTATKGTVSNHSITITPSVTNTAGYIAGETKTGTAVTVSASELVSGSKTKTANGTYDVTNLAELVVNVPTGTARSSSDLTVSGATVTVPTGLYSSQATKSVASGSAGTPTATKGTVSNHAITVTPSVTNTTGYITGGTKTGTGVTVSASELVSGSQTITANGNNIDVTNLASVNVAISYSTITVSSSNPSGGNNGDIWIKR